MSGEVDYIALGKALGQLNEALGYAMKEERGDPYLFEQFRNSAVHVFCYTFELAFKLLKRRVTAETAPEPASPGTPPNGPSAQPDYEGVIRLAARSVYLDDPERWLGYRTARINAGRGWDERCAVEAYAGAKAFYADGKILLERLKAAGET